MLFRWPIFPYNLLSIWVLSYNCFFTDLSVESVIHGFLFLNSVPPHPSILPQKVDVFNGCVITISKRKLILKKLSNFPKASLVSNRIGHWILACLSAYLILQPLFNTISDEQGLGLQGNWDWEAFCCSSSMHGVLSPFCCLLKPHCTHLSQVVCGSKGLCFLPQLHLSESSSGESSSWLSFLFMGEAGHRCCKWFFIDTSLSVISVHSATTSLWAHSWTLPFSVIKEKTQLMKTTCRHFTHSAKLNLDFMATQWS